MELSTLIEKLDTIQIQGELQRPIKGIAHHAQAVLPDYLFVAIKGTKQDGHYFLDEAFHRGATAALVEHQYPHRPGVTFITVPDTREALAQVAERFYHFPSRELKVVGITGTNGKTTTSYLLESIVQSAGYHPGIIGTINYRFGTQKYPAPNTTPDPLELQKTMRTMVDAGTTHLIMEVSSHALEQRRVRSVHFDVAVFTNLSSEHLDYHGTMEEYAQAKKLLFTHYLTNSAKDTTYAVINCDDPWGKSLCTFTTARLLRYGLGEGVEITAKDYQLSNEGISALLTTPQGDIPIRSSLLGRFNLSNILAAAGTALALGIPPEAISRGIAQLTTIPGRLEKIPNQKGATILIDYAHTSDALKQVLSMLAPLSKKRLITVFGCGGDRDRSKRGPMGTIATSHSDLTIITSDNPRTEDPMAIIAQIEAGIDPSRIKKYTVEELSLTKHLKGYLIIPERREAIRTALSLLKPGDILLVTGKGHEDYQIIGTTRYYFNDREEILHALNSSAPKGG